MYSLFTLFFFFFFNDTATTEIYTLSLHDALPISALLHELCGVEIRQRIMKDVGRFGNVALPSWLLIKGGLNMFRFLVRSFAGLSGFLALAALVACNSASATVIPSPVVDDPLATTSGQQTAVLAGGCFWGIQAVFEHVKGVISGTAGYYVGACSN